MGRVARYKKVKNSVKNFGQFLGSDKKNDPIVQSKSSVGVVDGFVIEGDSKTRKRRLLDLTKPIGSSGSEKKFSAVKRQEQNKWKKQKGESIRDFNARVNRDANEIVARSQRKDTNASKKKKDFFARRKEKKQKNKGKPRKMQPTDDYSHLNRSSNSTKSQVETRRVGLHDVAVKPPEFNFSNSRFKNMRSTSLNIK